MGRPTNRRGNIRERVPGWVNRSVKSVERGRPVYCGRLAVQLHGHTFATSDTGLRKDAIIVLPGQTVPVLFDAENPGRWMLHCHNAYHAEVGMMTQLGCGECDHGAEALPMTSVSGPPEHFVISYLRSLTRWDALGIGRLSRIPAGAKPDGVQR